MTQEEFGNIERTRRLIVYGHLAGKLEKEGYNMGQIELIISIFEKVYNNLDNFEGIEI